MPWGNLLQKNVTKCAAETLSVVALTNNRLSSYSYDAAGNMLSDGFHAYAYDAEGMMRQVDNGAATYFYDGSAQRTRKNVGGQQTHYINFGGSNIAEKNGTTGAGPITFSSTASASPAAIPRALFTIT